MNFLAIFENEWSPGQHEVCFRHDRFESVRRAHDLRQGETIQCVLLAAGRRGKALVVECTSDLVRLSIDVGEVLVPNSLFGIVAVSRPPTMRRIIFQSAMLGIQEIHITRAEKTDKSYLQSKVLEQSAIVKECITGIEQSGSCHVPKVFVYQRFSDCIEAIRGRDLRGAQGVVADPKAQVLLPSSSDNLENARSFFAVGPEKGWSDIELKSFFDSGFHGVSLGKRVLRVDTAFILLAARLSKI